MILDVIVIGQNIIKPGISAAAVANIFVASCSMVVQHLRPEDPIGLIAARANQPEGT
jgi:hypothetical protein